MSVTYGPVVGSGTEPRTKKMIFMKFDGNKMDFVRCILMNLMTCQEISDLTDRGSEVLAPVFLQQINLPLI